MPGPVSAMIERASRFPNRTAAAVLAICAYVPILLTDIGRVSADTKSYLTIDPSALLAQATSMWDPSVGAGTVPHQNIGYLFPLGPYYWLMDTIGIPDWITQRLLWGTIVFAAAYGTYRLARWLGWSASGAFVAGFAYGFSPYVLSYVARLSIILAPWAALPWMILLAAKAARTRSWKPAAQFAVVVALVGSVNATSLVLAGLGPVIWLITDVATGRVRAGAAVRAAAKIGVLSAAVSAWWIVALRVQGTYGIPILRYTETYESVAEASTPAEIIRGLGYWFLYGGDRLDPWVEPAGPYFNSIAVMAVGFVLSGIALLGFLTRFSGSRHHGGPPGRRTRCRRGCRAARQLDAVRTAVPLVRFGHHRRVGAAIDTARRPLVTLALAFGLAASTEWLRRRIANRSPRTIGFARPRPGGTHSHGRPGGGAVLPLVHVWRAVVVSPARRATAGLRHGVRRVARCQRRGTREPGASGRSLRQTSPTTDGEERSTPRCPASSTGRISPATSCSRGAWPRPTC